MHCTFLTDVDDIIDETLLFFRANTLFRNFDVRSGSDKTMIYLTLFAQQCLVKCERITDKNMAIKELKALATKQFVIPGESGWPLGGLFGAPADRKEADAFRAYFKQAREELAMRLITRLFDDAGEKNKWWQSFSKRKFMGKEFKD